MNECVGFMQGRLSEPVEGKIQAFPWNNWKDEFYEARNLRLGLMEWTLDQYRLHENPLMTHSGRKVIKKLAEETGVTVFSLTADCCMQFPFWKDSDGNSQGLRDDFISVCNACSSLGIGIIVLPLVDNGSLENAQQENELVKFMLGCERRLKAQKIKIAFESDYRPDRLRRFINKLPSSVFGINYDIGNSAALGFDPREEFSSFGSRVINVHVKDRLKGGGTVPLGFGNADFSAAFSELTKVGYDGNYILQTARAQDHDDIRLISKYYEMVSAWIASSKKQT
jgi:hexulose-6-phosphate isomerase